METWFTQIEHHVTFAGVMGMILGIGKWWLKERDVYKRVKSYTNELWFNYCGERQKLYVGVENGAQPIIPPRPTQGD